MNGTDKTGMNERGATVYVYQLPEARDLPLPSYQTADSAGLDLRAAVPEGAPLVLAAGRWALVPTGLKLAIPAGFEGQVRPRSDWRSSTASACSTARHDRRRLPRRARHHPVQLFRRAFAIRRGDRIAQLILSRVEQIPWVAVEQLPESGRGEGGFGHTGHQ